MHYLAIIAGKGGVGKTTVTILLARALQQAGFKIGILDGDIYGPSIGKYFVKGDVPKELDNGIAPADYCGIKNISLSYFQQKSKQISHLVRAPIANAIIESFIHEVVWEGLDFCLVDFPPGTGDVPLTLMQTISFAGAIVVTTPEEMAKWDVEKGVEMLFSMKVPILGVIQNKSYFQSGEAKISLYPGEAGRELAEKFAIDFLGELPFEPGILEALCEKKAWYTKSSFLLSFMEQIAVEISRKIWDNGNKEAVYLQKIDESCLEARFPDGSVRRYSPSEIQQKCPCAACSRKKEQVESLVLNVERIGNFGWKIKFSHGCSQGIYADILLSS